MLSQHLTIAEALRYANHDFLNQLQLIQMNLDLNRTVEAKKIIQEYTDSCRTTSNMNRLQLPQTIQWLLTAKWRFNAFQFHITSDVDTSQPMLFDAAIVEYLENTIIHIYDKLDPYSEQQLHVHIESTTEHFQITVHIQGCFEMTPFYNEIKQLKVHTYEQTKYSWKYVIERNRE